MKKIIFILLIFCCCNKESFFKQNIKHSMSIGNTYIINTQVYIIPNNKPLWMDKYFAYDSTITVQKNDLDKVRTEEYKKAFEYYEKGIKEISKEYDTEDAR